MSVARDWRVHPGELLRELLAERGVSQAHLARATGYTPKHINRLIKGRAALTPTMAVRLERELVGPTAAFWLGLQMDFDLRVAREAEAGRSTRRMQWTPADEARYREVVGE